MFGISDLSSEKIPIQEMKLERSKLIANVFPIIKQSKKVNVVQMLVVALVVETRKSMEKPLWRLRPKVFRMQDVKPLKL